MIDYFKSCKLEGIFIDHVRTTKSITSREVLNTVEVFLSGGYSKRQVATYPAHCDKSEAINDAFKSNYLDHNLNIISQTVKQDEK